MTADVEQPPRDIGSPDRHAPIIEAPLPAPRYSFGGDEFVYCELSQEMSFTANLKAFAICSELRRRSLAGMVEICPSNASYQVRIDPDELDPRRVVELLKELDASVDPTRLRLRARVIDVPAYYNDPWTHEVLMRFRDCHQDPSGTDLDYAARINGFPTVEAFIEAHHGSPFYVSKVGFVPGVPWLYQMVPQGRILEVPKYVRPRTVTPVLAIGHGGAFGCIYSVPGPGGYQLFGICPAPIFDPRLELPDFSSSFELFRPGDIVKFRPVDRAEHDAIRAEVEAKRFRYRMVELDFEPADFFADPGAYHDTLLGELYR